MSKQLTEAELKQSVASIPAERDVPPDVDDILSVKEELDLSSGKRADYRYRQFLAFLKSELAEAKSEIARLRPIEVEHSRLSQAHRSHRFIMALMSVGMVTGGGLVSTFQWHMEPLYFSIGWVLLGLCGFVQLCKSTLDL